MGSGITIDACAVLARAWISLRDRGETNPLIDRRTGRSYDLIPLLEAVHERTDGDPRIAALLAEAYAVEDREQHTLLRAVLAPEQRGGLPAPAVAVGVDDRVLPRGKVRSGGLDAVTEQLFHRGARLEDLVERECETLIRPPRVRGFDRLVIRKRDHEPVVALASGPEAREDGHRSLEIEIAIVFWQRHLFGAALALRYIALHSDILRYHVWIVLQSSHAE